MSVKNPTCSSCNDRAVQNSQDQICVPCLRLTRSRLHRVPQLVDDLEVSLARMAVLAERNDGGKSAETALAFTEAAGAVLREMDTVLVRWVRILNRQYGVPMPKREDLPYLAACVSVHAMKLVAHTDAAGLVFDFEHVVTQALAVIDLPVNRMRVKVGPCPEDRHNEYNDLGPCPGEVIATIPNGEDVRPEMKCTACESVWYPEQWAHAGDRIIKRASTAA